MKERLREAVQARVPFGAWILVISKGDDSLLLHEGRRAAHFPQQDDGSYAGHYPADGASALSHLSRLRDRGHGYLVVPSTSAWWLSHYRELGRYLAGSAREVFRSADTGVIFALPRAAVATDGRVTPCLAWEAGRLVKVLGRLLPQNSKVAVATEGSLPKLSLPGCEVESFALPPTSATPPSGEVVMVPGLIQGIEDLRGHGVEYLVLPADSSAGAHQRAGLVRHLEATCRCVLRQPHVAHVYRLGPPSTLPPNPLR